MTKRCICNISEWFENVNIGQIIYIFDLTSLDLFKNKFLLGKLHCYLGGA